MSHTNKIWHESTHSNKKNYTFTSSDDEIQQNKPILMNVLAQAAQVCIEMYQPGWYWNAAKRAGFNEEDMTPLLHNICHLWK